MACDNENKTCPSSTCHSGALLLGVVQSDKKVALLGTPIPVTEDFVEKAFIAGNPEKRLRFAGKCAKSGCSQWTGSRCGVIDEAMKQIQIAIDTTLLPECAIRPTCRWFDQNGPDACKVCPYIITDTTNAINYNKNRTHELAIGLDGDDEAGQQSDIVSTLFGG